MKSKLLILLFLLNASFIYTQDNTGLICGTVIDKATQVILIGATLLLLEMENKRTWQKNNSGNYVGYSEFNQS